MGDQKDFEPKRRRKRKRRRGERKREKREKGRGEGRRLGRKGWQEKKDSNHTQLTAKGTMLGFYIA